VLWESTLIKKSKIFPNFSKLVNFYRFRKAPELKRFGGLKHFNKRERLLKFENKIFRVILATNFSGQDYPEDRQEIG